MKIKTETMWAWTFGKSQVLCRWAAPSREQLLRDGKPTPEAKAVKVRVMPEQDFKKWLKLNKTAGLEY